MKGKEDRVGSLTLCKTCLNRVGLVGTGSRRNISHQLVTRSEPGSCMICEGRTSKLESIVERVVSKLADYDFDSFLVGTTVNQRFLEREDEIRSRLRIRGREGLKTQITRTIGAGIAELTGKKVEYNKPDVTILVSLLDGDSESITINPRTIWVYGRYLKNERGIPQKSKTCQVCSGLVCASCGFAGVNIRSIQSIAKEFFRTAFSAEDCNFIWLGGEDSNSLVLGNGRPFFAEILKPKKRAFDEPDRPTKKIMAPRPKRKDKLSPDESFPKSLDLSLSDGIRFRSFRKLASKPSSIPQFKITCEVNLLSSPTEKVSQIKVAEIETKFTDCDVFVQSSRRFKRTRKHLDWIEVSEAEDHSFARLKICCDGGIPIKKLVGGDGGDSVTPNLSEYIEGFRIDDSRPFDVLEVRLVEGADEQNHSANPGDIDRYQTINGKDVDRKIVNESDNVPRAVSKGKKKDRAQERLQSLA